MSYSHVTCIVLSIQVTTSSGNTDKLSLNERRLYGKITVLKLNLSEVYTYKLYEMNTEVALDE
jgi:hypothetical protein